MKLTNQQTESYPKEGDIVLIKGEEKNRMCKFGKVTMLIRGRDGVVRGVQLQCGTISFESQTNWSIFKN